jgi:hypothetical protein
MKKSRTEKFAKIDFQNVVENIGLFAPKLSF